MWRSNQVAGYRRCSQAIRISGQRQVHRGIVVYETHEVVSKYVFLFLSLHLVNQDVQHRINIGKETAL